MEARGTARRLRWWPASVIVAALLACGCMVPQDPPPGAADTGASVGGERSTGSVAAEAGEDAYLQSLRESGVLQEGGVSAVYSKDNMELYRLDMTDGFGNRSTAWVLAFSGMPVCSVETDGPQGPPKEVMVSEAGRSSVQVRMDPATGSVRSVTYWHYSDTEMTSEDFLALTDLDLDGVVDERTETPGFKDERFGTHKGLTLMMDGGWTPGRREDGKTKAQIGGEWKDVEFKAGRWQVAG